MSAPDRPTAGEPDRNDALSGGGAAGRYVRVYRSSRTPGMYLYVDGRDNLAAVPEALLSMFGKPVEALSLMLTAERSLARADAAAVLASIEEQGFYLQLPPGPEPQREPEPGARP